MALFDERDVTPVRSRRRSRRLVTGLWAMTIAVLALLGLTLLPTEYVIQQPGPVVDTLGTAETADGEDVPLISISGAETYPTAGTLDLLTVQVVGNREHRLTWLQLAGAWFDKTRAIIPIDEVFPAGQTSEERNAESAVMMTDSQKEATAAALSELDYEVQPRVMVEQLMEGSPAEGVLEPGDIILRAEGADVVTTADLREAIAARDGEPVRVEIERDGAPEEVEITPMRGELDGEPAWVISVLTSADYDFPIDVTIQIDNIGGPSAGMMFALGIVDMLTPGELNGGQDVAGTGTIDAAGTVGRIGGIRQKLYGADEAGADYFLAPAGNCDEVVGHIPGDLQVFAVSTLEDSITVLDTISDDGDLTALPTCETALAGQG